MKIGILGLGSIGMRHARNLKMMGHQVIGYDTDMKKRLALSGVLWDRDEVIESDAILICTPTNRHYDDWATMSARAKIFMEKPLGTCAQIAQFWQEDLLKELFLGYFLRFHPCIKAAKNWIDAGHIGTPLWATFICGQYNDKPDYLRDGVVLNWSHEIDLALYLLGPAKVVAASVHVVDGKDDIADIVLEHDSGARSTIHLDYVTRNEIREGWIVGTEKNIGLDMLGRQVSFGKMTQQFGGEWNDDYIDEMQAFIGGIAPTRTAAEPPVQWATGEDGLRVLEICRQVKEKVGLG